MKHELSVGMYVRSKQGDIDKIFLIDEIYCDLEEKDGYGVNYVMYVNDIKKSSYNIIDLIEVGDYVNGVQVVEVKNNQVFTDDINWNEISDLETDMGRIIGYGYERLPIDNIKSIVTKEQFKSVEYEV